MEKLIASPPARYAPADAAEGGSRQIHLLLVLIAAHIAIDWLTNFFPGRFGVTPFNPQAAIGIAILLFCGLKYTPAVFLTVAVFELVLVSWPRPFGVALLTTTLITAMSVAIAVVLQRSLRIRTDLSRRYDVVSLILVTLVTTLSCGLVYIGVLMYFDVGNGGRYFYGVRRFVIGYSVGILIAAPVVWMLLNAVRRTQFAAFFRSVEGWLQIAAIAVLSGWVFTQDKSVHVNSFYMLFLPVIWAAFRFGMVGAAVSLALTQLGVYLLYFATAYNPMPVFELQLLMIALAITGLLLGVAIDEQRRATQDVRLSLKLAAAGEMAAAMAHEINQPLTALSSYATAGELLASAPELDRERLAATLTKVRMESERTAAVVQRLRDFFRSGATHLEPVVLEALVAKVMARAQSRAQAQGVAISTQSLGQLPCVLADELQLEVVLRNLIANAIDSTAEAGGGRVQVELAAQGADETVVTVRDEGQGIPAADVERLFTPFVTSKSTGMGMGLAICRAIVEAHGGRIWAVPGRGGMVCFALPVAGNAAGIIK